MLLERRRLCSGYYCSGFSFVRSAPESPVVSPKEYSPSFGRATQQHKYRPFLNKESEHHAVCNTRFRLPDSPLSSLSFAGLSRVRLLPRHPGGMVPRPPGLGVAVSLQGGVHLDDPSRQAPLHLRRLPGPPGHRRPRNRQRSASQPRFLRERGQVRKRSDRFVDLDFFARG